MTITPVANTIRVATPQIANVNQTLRVTNVTTTVNIFYCFKLKVLNVESM